MRERAFGELATYAFGTAIGVSGVDNAMARRRINRKAKKMRA